MDENSEDNIISENTTGSTGNSSNFLFGIVLSPLIFIRLIKIRRKRK